MTVFNIKHVQMVWRGITLQGFSGVKVSAVEKTSSNKTVIGIAGECFKHPDNTRQWTITSEFNVFSLSYPILEQDNLNNIEDTLIVRDLNNGTTEIYTHCTIDSITTAENGYNKIVQWSAVKKNGR